MRSDPTGESQEFVLRATRNTATLYPGPLARAAHMAFLDIATECGLPLENPVTWSWRDLCRRMGVNYSGREALQLKAAIKSTKALLIESDYAIYSKPEGSRIRTREDALNLYDRVTIVGDELPDGTKADANYLWLAEWYLQNLNAMFSAPLNYELWRWLDQRSSIASRLYEFLMLNFYSGVPVLRINYHNLVQFLPVRRERYESDAKRQLGPALDLLIQVDALERALWMKSKAGLPQLHLHRGDRLTAPRDQRQIVMPFMQEEFTGSVTVKELRGLKPPEHLIVADFYRLWSGDERHRPTTKELAQARELIEHTGHAKAKALIPLVVKRMKKKWPEAKTFGASTKYISEVMADYDKEQRRVEHQRAEQLQRKRDQDEAQRKAAEDEKLLGTWRPVWERLPEAEKEEIRKAVGADKHRWLGPAARAIEDRLCIRELADRHSRQTTPA
ncbi:MAG: hypothetical protein HY000_19060 [Planctomycetes bacterium]|nr:hypothetical protein [Planctomycetota bacterium]